MDLWSWGAGSQGQLGVGSLDDSLLPVQLQSEFPLLQLACGGAHVVAITTEGRVAAWGRGSVGHDDAENDDPVSVPRIVTSLRDHRISKVAAGWNHTAFLSESGELFMCGDGAFGQLGLGDFLPRTLPCKVLSSVRLVACGMRHTLVVTRDGVMTFGHAKRGQLGIITLLKNICTPQEVLALRGHNLSHLAANGDHSGALDCSGRLYLWGKSFSNGSAVPVTMLKAPKFQQISLGWNHGLGLAGDGVVFSWGSNKYGQLGRRSGGLAIDQVESLRDKRAVSVSAGAEHSAAVLDSGEVMTWGWGEHGQLGLGSTADEHHPHKVYLQSSHRIASVYCGSGFTYASRSLAEN